MLEASLHLVDSPAFKSLLVLGYPDVYTAGDHVAEILEAGPIGLEGLDDILVDDMKKKDIHPQDITLLPEGRRLAPGRIRRRNQGRSRRQGPRA